MKRSVIVPFICIVVAVATAVGASLMAQGTAAPNAAKLQQVMNAWATLDPGKVAVFYAKDPGLAFYDLSPLKYSGWAAYDKGVRDLFKDVKSMSATVGKDADVHVSGNIAWSTAVVDIDMAMKDGSRERLQARWTLVWEKRGSDWLIVHEHASAPLPPPPTPPTPPAPPKK